jgi:hypothetical protein
MEEDPKIVNFVFVYRHNQNPIRLQQPLRQQQALLYHGEPFGVPEGVGLVHVVVVILPIPRAGVVGRVDVDDVHLALVAVEQELEGMKIIGIDEHMPRLLRPTSRHAVNRDESRIDGVAKAPDHY